jgi:hypothetical protein
VNGFDIMWLLQCLVLALAAAVHAQTGTDPVHHNIHLQKEACAARTSCVLIWLCFHALSRIYTVFLISKTLLDSSLPCEYRGHTGQMLL